MIKDLIHGSLMATLSPYYNRYRNADEQHEQPTDQKLSGSFVPRP